MRELKIVLVTQLPVVVIDTAFARTRSGKISAGYTQQMGPQEYAKLSMKNTINEMAAVPAKTATGRAPCHSEPQ